MKVYIRTTEIAWYSVEIPDKTPKAKIEAKAVKAFENGDRKYERTDSTEVLGVTAE